MWWLGKGWGGARKKILKEGDGQVPARGVIPKKTTPAHTYMYRWQNGGDPTR